MRYAPVSCIINENIYIILYIYMYVCIRLIKLIDSFALTNGNGSNQNETTI